MRALRWRGALRGPGRLRGRPRSVPGVEAYLAHLAEGRHRQPIAEPARGPDLDVAHAVPRELLAQPADVDVDEPASIPVGVAPHSQQELLARDDLPGTLREYDEELELRRRELDRRGVVHRVHRREVDRETSEAEERRLGLTARPIELVTVVERRIADA